jgi:hypothetical protein
MLEVETRLTNMKKYYEDHKEFFLNRNLPWGHPYLSSGVIPLAELDLVPDDLIDKLETRQWAKSVTLI